MWTFENTDFFRVIEGRATRIASSFTPKRVRHTVSVAPLKSVAISPFSFPFNNVLRIREALKLQVLPYAAAGGMELFPSLLDKTARGSSGVAWFVPTGELENVTAPMTQVENRVWPAPLPLVSKVEGEGVTFWLDEGSICSMLWRGGAPVLYRWKPRGERELKENTDENTDEARPAPFTLESERSWYEAYCKSKGEETGKIFTLDATQPSALAQFSEIVRESLKLCPWIGDVNLSRSAFDNALVLERAVRSLSRVASWLLVMGLFVLSGNGLRYYEARRSIDELRERSSELYRSTFDPSRTGRIPDPLGLALSKIAELRGDAGEGRLINEVFADLGDIFEQNPSMDVTLDSVRYNLEGIDYTGSAPDMETAQEFRRAWVERANAGPLNLQNAPGVGYRFDLSVKW
ncbi:MAG: hypothetical protein LBP21_06140 [Synergistaceae bacterium]|jgi:hypothetical protein|nr:hypothetical protein [Synergistaceae bacterium]